MKGFRFIPAWDAMALNPVMVKELRQVVRSRFMVSILMFFLIVLLGAVGSFVIFNSIGSAFGAGMRADSGRQLFQILMPVLNAACFLFVPAYVGVRLAAERSDTNIDLLFTTSISPGAIIRGKLYSGVLVTALLCSITTPFLAFTYLLRGIDLPTIFIAVALMVLLNVLAVQGGIFLGAIPASKVFKSLLSAVVSLWLFGLIPLSAAMTNDMLRTGFGGTLTTARFWGTAAAAAAAWAGALLLLHVFSVVMIMPPASNRALPIRVTLSALWICGAAASALAFVLDDAREALLYVWVGPGAVACAATILMAVSERDHLGPRILRTIPAGRAGRLLAFLFYSGAGGGIVWTLLTASVTLGVGMAAARVDKAYDRIVPSFALLFVYVYDYALTAAWLRNTFLARRAPRRATWVIALLLIAAGSFLPTVVTFLRHGGPMQLKEYQYGNIFASFDPVFRPTHFWFAGLWALVVTCLNVRWIVAQYRAFRRVEPNGRRAAGSPAA